MRIKRKLYNFDTDSVDIVQVNNVTQYSGYPHLYYKYEDGCNFTYVKKGEDYYFIGVGNDSLNKYTLEFIENEFNERIENYQAEEYILPLWVAYAYLDKLDLFAKHLEQFRSVNEKRTAERQAKEQRELVERQQKMANEIAEIKAKINGNEYITGAELRIILTHYKNHGFNLRTLGMIYNSDRILKFGADGVDIYGDCSNQTYRNITNIYKSLQELVA